MNSFGEPLRFNKIEKTEKRKKDNRLSLSVSTTIGVVLRGLQIFYTHFSSHPSDTQEFNQTKSTFSYVNLSSYKSPQEYIQTAFCRLGRGGRQVSSTCILNKRPHLYPQKEISLAPSKKTSLAPSKGHTFGPFEGA